ncbi:MAG: ABC transporter ATP-binding protein, partial [Firmicutes bacterium]|nr:ABC transporter ATP-binding protein [Bacillota bacterium]
MSKNTKHSSSSPRRGHRGGGPPHARFDKPRDFKTTFMKLVKYLQPYKTKLLIVGLFAVGSTAFSIAGPKILGKATTKIFEGLVSKVSGLEGAGVDFQYISRIIFGLIALYLASALFSYIQGFIVAGVAQDVSYNLRREISRKINRLPLKYFDRTSFGDVLSRVTNDVDTVSHTLSQSTTQIITSVTTFVGVLIMMLSISWEMTLIALVMLPITMILVMLVVKHSQKYFKAQQESLGRVNGHVEEVFGGHIIMKAFNAEKEETEEFDRINNELYESAWKSQFISGLMGPIMNFIGNLGYVVVTILGGWFAIRNTIQVGD